MVDLENTSSTARLPEEEANIDSSEEPLSTDVTLPPSPPDHSGGEGNSNELKISRKREREVSLEPATPQATSIDVDTHIEHKSQDRDRRTPAKKNRTSGQLDVTQEQEEDVFLDDSDSPVNNQHDLLHSPPTPPHDTAHRVGEVSCSPPHETKIRIISRGVQGLSWKSFQDPEDGEQQDGDEMDHDAIEGQTKAEEPKESVSPTPPLPIGENPSLADDSIVDEDEHTGGVDLTEVPPTTQSAMESGSESVSHGITLEGQEEEEQASTSSPETTSPTIPSTEPTSTSTPSAAASHPLPPSPPPDQDDVKGLKRKLGDRTVSERDLPGAKASLAVGASGLSGPEGVKRQRDDEDDIEQRRVAKRASPPLEDKPKEKVKEKKEEKKQDSRFTAPTSKFGGFMAYASTSSPFASVKGPNIFSSSGSGSTSSPSSSKPSPWSSNNTATSSGNPFTSFTQSTHTLTSSPPSNKPDIISPTAQKRTGFEAFASTTSPFATAAKRPKSPPPPSMSTTDIPAFASSSHSHSHTSLGGGHGHGGVFGRSKSPIRTHSPSPASVNAFSAYAIGGAHGFTTTTATSSTSTSSRSGTPGGEAVFGATSHSFGSGGGSHGSGIGSRGGVMGSSLFAGGGVDEIGEKGVGLSNGSSFGARLRAEKDREDEDSEGGEGTKVELTEQEVLTGEEDEETVYQVRGKLFTLSPQNTWKEKGTGQIRLNVRREDGSGARLVMRKEAVYTLLLNATLFKGMKCFLAQDPRYLRFSVFEGGATTHYNLRVSNAKIAEDLLEEINSHIPGE